MNGKTPLYQDDEPKLSRIHRRSMRVRVFIMVMIVSAFALWGILLGAGNFRIQPNTVITVSPPLQSTVTPVPIK